MRVEDVDGPVVAAATRTPFEARRRVFVLERVDTMNDEVANRMLKTLEEPASFVHLILLTDALGRVLDTVDLALPAGALRPAAGGADRRGARGRGRRGRRGRRLRAAGARQRRAGARCWPRPTAPALRADVEAFVDGRARQGEPRRVVARRCSSEPRRAGPRPRTRWSSRRRRATRAGAEGPRAQGARARARGGGQARRPPRAHRGARPGTDADRRWPSATWSAWPRRRPRPCWRATAPPRWPSAPAGATRAGCARRPSAARTCASRSS